MKKSEEQLINEIRLGRAKSINLMSFNNEIITDSVLEEIFKVESLKSLKIIDSKIRTIPSSIEQLQNLTHFDLSNNEIHPPLKK